jgi:hypothetical protein
VQYAIAESLSPGHFDLTVLIYILNIWIFINKPLVQITFFAC